MRGAIFCVALLWAVPAHAAGKLMLYIPNLVAATLHSQHSPPASTGTVEFQNPSGFPGRSQVLVNPGSFAGMPDSSVTLFFNWIYNSDYTFPAKPDGDRGYGTILNNIDEYEMGSLLIRVLPPGTVRGISTPYPVLSVSVSNGVWMAQRTEYLVPNMILNDKNWHSVEFALGVYNGSWIAKVRQDNVYDFSSVVLAYVGGDRVLTNATAFPIPLNKSPISGTPYTYTFGNIVACACKGYVPLDEPGKEGIRGLNAATARFFFWPNSPIDPLYNSVNNVFWNDATGKATVISNNGANTLFPGQRPPPILLEGDWTPGGFGLNGGIIESSDGPHVTSFVVPAGTINYDRPTAAPTNPYP